MGTPGPRGHLRAALWWAVGLAFLWAGVANLRRGGAGGSSPPPPRRQQQRQQREYSVGVDVTAKPSPEAASTTLATAGAKASATRASEAPATARPAPQLFGNRSALTGGDMMLVTACSNSHLCALLQLLASLNASAPGAPVLVYDLNPPPGPFMAIGDLRKANPSVLDVRRFDYGRHPAHYNVLRRAGQWAWKTAIIKEVVDEFGTALWLDSGAVLMQGRGLSAARALIADGDGFFSAVSRGSTFQFVHPGTWAHFGLAKCCNAEDKRPRGTPPCCCCTGWSERGCLDCGPTSPAPPGAPQPPPVNFGKSRAGGGGRGGGGGGAGAGAALTEANMTWWRSVPMCNGAIIGVSRKGRAYNNVLVPWEECARDVTCIAPTVKGSASNRNNHRQDQAALTMIAALSGFRCAKRSVDAGFALHKDEVVDTAACAALLGRPAPTHGRVW